MLRRQNILNLREFSPSPRAEFEELFNKKLKWTAGQKAAERSNERGMQNRRLGWERERLGKEQALSREQHGQDYALNRDKFAFEREKFGKEFNQRGTQWLKNYQLNRNKFSWDRYTDQEDLNLKRMALENQPRYQLHTDEWTGASRSYDPVTGTFRSATGEDGSTNTTGFPAAKKGKDKLTQKDHEEHVRWLANQPKEEREAAIAAVGKVDPKAVDMFNQLATEGELTKPWYSMFSNESIAKGIKRMIPERQEGKPWYSAFYGDQLLKNINKMVYTPDEWFDYDDKKQFSREYTQKVLEAGLPVDKIKDKRGLPTFLGGTPY